MIEMTIQLVSTGNNETKTSIFLNENDFLGGIDNLKEELQVATALLGYMYLAQQDIAGQVRREELDPLMKRAHDTLEKFLGELLDNLRNKRKE